MFSLSPKSWMELCFDPVPHITDKTQPRESTTRDVLFRAAGTPTGSHLRLRPPWDPSLSSMGSSATWGVQSQLESERSPAQTGVKEGSFGAFPWQQRVVQAVENT